MKCHECGSEMSAKVTYRRNCINTQYTCCECGYTDFDFDLIKAGSLTPVAGKRGGNISRMMFREFEWVTARMKDERDT